MSDGFRMQEEDFAYISVGNAVDGVHADLTVRIVAIAHDTVIRKNWKQSWIFSILSSSVRK